MYHNSSITRRHFLAATSMAAAFPAIVPSSVFGADAAPAPSERVALGFIGTGEHGVNMNLMGFLHQPESQVVAVCDVDARRMRKAAEIAADKQGATPELVHDWRELIARDDIDAVVVSTPDHWHVPCAIAALRAGKDVFSEKPLTLTIDEGKQLAAAARASDRITITGSENRSKPNFLTACEYVRNGRIGKLETIRTYLPGGWSIRDRQWLPEEVYDVENNLTKAQPVPEGFDYDMWLGPAPDAPYHPARCHWNFRWLFDYSGGNLTDWGAHIIDIAQWGNDTEHTGPISAQGTGELAAHPLYNTYTAWHIEYDYANGVHLTCDSIPKDAKVGRARVRFEGKDGWIECDWDNIQASDKAILDEPLGEKDLRLRTNPKAEHRDFLDCVRSRKPTYAPFEVGHRTISIAHLGHIALRLGRKLRWDPEQEVFPDDDSANAYLSRQRREPWAVL